MRNRGVTLAKQSEAAQRGAARRRGKASVLLVDDHPILRNGLKELINQEDDLLVCGEAEEARAALDCVSSLRPDLSIIDISLREGDGLELIKNIKAQYPDLSMLVLSMHDEGHYAERALRAGSLGYVMKHEAIGKIIPAIRQVLAGAMFLSDPLKKRLLQQMVCGSTREGGSSIENLSDRELQVFRLIGEGRGTRRIAEELQLSIRTVDAYREYIKDKLAFKTGIELLRHAFRYVHCGIST